MKKLFILFLLLPVTAFGATYTVTQTGSGADYSAATFNAESGDFSDDTFYFSGTFTSDLIPDVYGTSGSPVVLDGYQAGTCDPINDDCASGALLNNIVFWIKGGNDYITVKDFNIQTGDENSEGGNACIYVNELNHTSEVSDHIIIEYNYIHDCENELVRVTKVNPGGSGSDGSDYITMRYNKMVGYGDSVNASTGLLCYYCNDWVLEYNELAGDGTSICQSDNVVSLNAVERALVQYNYIHDAHEQAGIAIKEDGGDYANDDIIVRFNVLRANGSQDSYGKGGRGMFVGTAQDTYIYGNLIIANQEFGIDLSDGLDGIHIWSNIIANHDEMGISLWQRGAVVDDVNIVNNTIVRNGLGTTTSGNSTHCGISLVDNTATNITVKNNILDDNRLNASAGYTQQVFVSSGTQSAITLEHNTYDHASESPTIVAYWDSGYRNLTYMQNDSKEDDAPAGEDGDPAFKDPDGADTTYGTEDDDYTLASNSPSINDGADLSACFEVTVQGTLYTICLDDGLDPDNTDWTTTPPTVGTLKQDDNGDWERGAYVHPASSIQGITIN